MQLVDDARRIQVEIRGEPVDIDVPPPPAHDLLDLASERAADDERRGGAHETPCSCGKPSTELKASLKSDRPDRSTYSRRAGSSHATCASRYDRKAIVRRSAAALPPARILAT